MKRLVSAALSIFKYIVALFMMYAGAATMFAHAEDDGSRLGWLYESRTTLVILGFIFFLSGAVLLYGKVRKMRKTIGYGLMLVYLCFLFATILTCYGYGFKDAIPNGIGTIITGALYLRWKYHIYYYQPSVDSIRARMLG